MIIGTCMVYLRAEWVCSLKEKRMIVKSLMDKMKHKFNISVAEIDKQDEHRNIVIGFACVSNQVSHANSMIDHVIRFVEQNTDAELVDTVIEII